MSDLSKTLEQVSVFLREKGCDTQPYDEQIQNGRWLYEWCEKYRSGELCPCGMQAALQRLFVQLEAGSYLGDELSRTKQSGWTRAHTNAALQIGGFPKWPEEENSRRGR